MSQTPSPIDYQPNAGEPARTTLMQRIILTALWSVLLIVIFGVVMSKVVTWAHPAVPKTNSFPSGRAADVLFPAPRFALTDQEGRPFSAVDLHGKAYICDFIFTSCGQICPMMTHKLADVQSHTPAQLQLVSFTVNPEYDTSAVLKVYATANGADPGRWHFLRGTAEQMTDTVRKMNLAFQPAQNKDPILHSPKFLLVDGDGNVRGVYDSNIDQEMKDLVIDAAWLATTPGAVGK